MCVYSQCQHVIEPYSDKWQVTVTFLKCMTCMGASYDDGCLDRWLARCNVGHIQHLQHYFAICAVCVYVYRVSQEECAILRESVPYVKLYQYNPKHLYPKLNGYGDNGQRSLKL